MKIEEIGDVIKIISEEGKFLCRIKEIDFESKPLIKELWLAKSEKPEDYTELDDSLAENITFKIIQQELQNTQEILNENLLEDMDEIAREQKEIMEE